MLSRGCSLVAMHRLLIEVPFRPQGGHGLVGSSVRTGLVVSWGKLRCCGRGEGSCGHFFLENRRVFPVKKVLPERHGDWISEMTADEIYLVGPSALQRGPLGYLGARDPAPYPCLCRSQGLTKAKEWGC